MDFFRHIPKGFYQNLEFRDQLLTECRCNPKLCRALKEYCAKDILFYVNAFIFTYDPRLPDKIIPFVTYDYQDEAILEMQAAIRAGDPAVVPKSRDMGASWLMLLVFDHFSTFQRNCKFFMMSRKKELVDHKDDSDSLFWKIDFIHQYLPWFLRPAIELSHFKVRPNMRINYLETNSVIIGATTTKSSGVGGRATAAGVDELSRYHPKVAEQVMSGLKDVTNCIIYPFTKSPEMGKAHPSYQLVESARAGNLRYIPMHWTQHPVKAKGHYRVDQKTRNIVTVDKSYQFPIDYKWQIDGRFEHHSPWFDKYRLESNDQTVADNLEFDDDVVAHSCFNQQIVLDHIADHSRPPTLEGDLEYHEVTGDPIGWIDMVGGPIRLWTQLDIHGKPPQVTYSAGEDTSLGVGATPSCLSAARCDTGEKVLEFVECYMRPDQFAVKCVAICLWLSSPGNRTLLGWERGGPGDTFGIEVIKLGYYPVYYHIDTTKTLMNRRAPTPGVVVQIRGTMFTNYETDLAKAEFINPSERALRNMFGWQNSAFGPKHDQYKNSVSDPSGAKLNHGDISVADAICAMMRRHVGGGVTVKEKEIVLPGSLAWIMKQDEHRKVSSRALYPNWNK